jgi:hypothetical protein
MTTAAAVINRGSNMNIRSLLNATQQTTTNPTTLTMLSSQPNLISATPYATYPTAYPSSYTLGGALPTSYAYPNAPYNYAASTTPTAAAAAAAYGGVDRLSAMQQSTASTASLMAATPGLFLIIYVHTKHTHTH